MSKGAHRLTVLMLSLATCAALADQAAAQDNKSGDPIPAGNPEFGPGDSDPIKPKGLETKFRMGSEIHAFENKDFRELDESSDQAIIDSDDRHTFAYSTLSAFLGYQINEDLRVNVGVAHNGLWSRDQIGGQAQLAGALFFSHLNMIYSPINTDDFKLSFSVGRQPFAIGGVPKDYFLDDLLDSVVVEADAGKAGRLRILALDFFTSSDLPRASFTRYVSGRETTLGLRGDTFTLRTGGVYENDKIVDGLTVKAYYFFADMGGGPVDESGADISFGGSLGNFADNDFVWMAGGRVSYDLDLGDTGNVLFYGDFAHSSGIDRKEVVAFDVDISGNAFGGGVDSKLSFGESFGLEFAADFYRFDGPEYSQNGLRFQHGFVGFRGRRIGGLNADRYAGWFPSAVMSAGGLNFREHEPARARGTQSLHAGLGFVIMQNTLLRADMWLLQDTGSSNLNQADLDNIDPPFGYSREEFFAQSRLGLDLGTEIDLQLTHRFNENLKGFIVYGLFMPGDFYGIEINRVGGNARGSNDPQNFWGFTAGTTVEF